MTVWQLYYWPYQTHRIWILFQLCLSAIVAKCLTTLHFLKFCCAGRVMISCRYQFQPVCWTADRGSKSFFLTAVLCQVMVRVSTSLSSLSFSTFQVWQIKQSFLHPSTILEPVCADHNTASAFLGDLFWNVVINTLLYLITQ